MTEYNKQKWGNRGKHFISFAVGLVILFILLVAGRMIIERVLNIGIDITGYYVFFAGVILAGFQVGRSSAALHKSWDLQSFVERVENVHTADYIIFNLQRKKELMGWPKTSFNFDPEKKEGKGVK